MPFYVSSELWNNTLKTHRKSKHANRYLGFNTTNISDVIPRLHLAAWGATTASLLFHWQISDLLHLVVVQSYNWAQFLLCSVNPAHPFPTEHIYICIAAPAFSLYPVFVLLHHCFFLHRMKLQLCFSVFVWEIFPSLLSFLSINPWISEPARYSPPSSFACFHKTTPPLLTSHCACVFTVLFVMGIVMRQNCSVVFSNTSLSASLQKLSGVGKIKLLMCCKPAWLVTQVQSKWSRFEHEVHFLPASNSITTPSYHSSISTSPQKRELHKAGGMGPVWKWIRSSADFYSWMFLIDGSLTSVL